MAKCFTFLGTMFGSDWVGKINESDPLNVKNSNQCLFFAECNPKWHSFILIAILLVQSDFLYAHSGNNFHSNHFLDAATSFCSSRGFSHIAANDNFYGNFRYSGQEPWNQEDVVRCETDSGGNKIQNCELFSTGSSTIICRDEGNGSNAGDGDNNTCKPVNISTGNKFFRVTDHQNNSLQLSRFYNSGIDGWTFLYRQRLIINTVSIFSKREDGKTISFYKNGNDYVVSSQRRERLSFDGSIYTLTLPGNHYETYDITGRLLSINSLYDDPIILNYTANTITISKDGEQLVLTTDDDNVIEANFSDGATVSYIYESEQLSLNTTILKLSVVSYADNSNLTYFYEDSRHPRYITGIEDENNNRISSVQYDSIGKAISSEKGPLDSGIERKQIQYNDDGTRTLTNALGKQSTYHFTQFNGEYLMTQVEGHPSANCSGANKNYTYDANGFMASKTDWANNVTTYIHNDRGQELSRTEASGTTQARTITTEWHADFNLPVRIIESERETVMTYDTSGRLLSRQVEPRSN